MIYAHNRSIAESNDYQRVMENSKVSLALNLNISIGRFFGFSTSWGVSNVLRSVLLLSHEQVADLVHLLRKHIRVLFMGRHTLL